jgi:uncharacterized MAPEG superfamily protein
MTPELHLLVWTVVLTVVQMLVAVTAANTQIPLTTLAQNRENLPELTDWAGRAQRAHRNMLENLPLFIGLVLVAHIAGRANPMTLLGAQLFFWARLVYAVVYVAGVPWVRTAVWAVSAVGLILIFLQLL